MIRRGTFREKRQHPRAEVDILVHVRNQDRGRFYHSRSISGGGVFLLSDDPLAEETRVSLELHLPRVEVPVKAEGEVVWKQRQGPSGFAVQFTEISELARHLIRLQVRAA